MKPEVPPPHPSPVERNNSKPLPTTPEIEAKHRESVARYPQLALSSSEYVIEEVRRHPIILFGIWLLVAIIIVLLFGVLSFYGLNRGALASFLFINANLLPSAATVFPLALIFAAFVVLGGVVSTIVYLGNRFYLTNESVFQFVQTSLFNTRTQVINLINVEDASQDQQGILQQLLDFGTLRLSTQGEETTYHFYFVANPRRLVGIINEASEKAVLRMQGFPVTEH